MPRIDVYFTCTEQDLTPPSKRLRAGDKNYFYAVFSLCEKWQGMQVRARFRRTDVLMPYVVDLTETADGKKECLIPWEVLTDHGTVYVGIFAGDLILTNEAPLYIDVAFDPTGGENPKDPTRDWFATTEEHLAELDEKLKQSVEPPVKSVNGKQGDVKLTAQDVGALPADTQIPTVPENVGAFENDAGYQTAAQVAATAKAAASAVEAKIPTVPENVGAFENDAGYQTAAQVEAIAKAKAAEVEAKLPTVPTNVSAFANDAKYQTETQVAQTVKAASDLAAAEIAKKANEGHTHDDRYYTEGETDALLAEKQDAIPHYVATVNGQSGDATVTPENIGAEKAGTAAAQVTAHNTNGEAHNDIRLLLQQLTNKVNAVLDSDDTTLDQMSEIVSYIKNNADLIEAVTTNKVNYSDIVNDLSTNVSNKPLSAAQGVALKALIDAITVPTKVSELTNDANYQNAEQVASAAQSAAQTAAAAVEKKIPTVPTNVSAFTNDAKYATETQVTQAAAAVAEMIPEVPANVGAFNNDAGYQTAAQVEATATAKAAAVEAKIPTVPTKVSQFTNDSGYQTAAQVEATATAKAAAVEAKIPTVPTKVSQFTNDAGYQNAEQVQAAASAVDKTFVFELVVTLSANGVSLSLPQGVTYDTLNNAVNKNFHVVGIMEIPSAAGDLSGVYTVPFTRKLSSGTLGFSTTGEGLLMFMWIGTDSSVSFGYYNIERQSNKVTELSASSTDAQYPTAKAVYDYIESRLNGLTFKVADSAPTEDNPNTITFVDEG